jgi:hypothetical protein
MVMSIFAWNKKPWGLPCGFFLFHGISTKTGYKWRERFLAQGYVGLEEESRKPKSNGKALEEWISVEFLRIKKKHEVWGRRKY